MCYAAVLPGFARRPRAERLWANSCVPPHSTAQAGACSLWRSREPGSLEPGATEQRALRMPSPFLLRRERAVVGRGHGQRTRERRWRRAVPRQLGRVRAVLRRKEQTYEQV